jgi:hypothetical protein
MNTAWVIVIILFVAWVLTYLRIITLEREIKKLNEGRKFYGDKCRSCVKRNQASCPRCTLYLTECSYYVSPEQHAIWGKSDPFER